MAAPPVPPMAAGRDTPASTVRATGPQAIRIVNLVSADLTAEREQWLVAGLITALPSLRMAELFAQRRDMLRDVDLVTVAVTDGDGGSGCIGGGAGVGVGGPSGVAKQDGMAGPDGMAGDLAGLLASKWTVSAADEEFLHITAQFVAECQRHGRVFRLSWAAHFAEVCRRQRDCPGLSVLKTSNPLVYCAMRVFTRLLGVTMYPEIGALVQDSDLTRRAGEIAKVIAPEYGFSGGTGVIHDIGVPSDLYRTTPLSADRRVNAYFARNAGPADRMLCMLAIPSRAVAEHVLRALGAPEVFADSA